MWLLRNPDSPVSSLPAHILICNASTLYLSLHPFFFFFSFSPMSSRTANWVSRTTPGAAPPPPSRAATSYPPSPPSTIYPESSVSNPSASRYTRRSSHTRSQSMGPPPASRYSTTYSPPPTHARSSSSSHYTTSSSRRSSSIPVTTTSTPVNTYYAPSRQPIIARTSDHDGRTDSYMIIPAKGQRVEILVR